METKTYFFQPEKKFLKQGFYMVDEEKNTIYEAKMLKQPLLGAMTFEFINHITNKKEEHKVGHTATIEQTTNNMVDFMSTKSHFKFDGKKIWDYLHEIGIRIDSQVSSNNIGMTYIVSLKGNEIATIQTASGSGKGLITNHHCYNVTTTEDNLDLAFLVTFSMARTDQLAYD